MNVSARIQQAENGFIVTVEHQRMDFWEDKRYVASTKEEAKKIIDDAFKELKTSK